MTTTPPVKICGITRLADAELAIAHGAWGLGFIFHEKSPRYIKPSEAKTLVARLGAGGVKLVGVFVNAKADDIRRIAGEVALTTVQLHGDESPEFCRGLGLETIKAIRPATIEDVQQLGRFSDAKVSAFLVDAPPGASGNGARGGTGRLAVWVLATAAKAYGKVMLSGGLKAENVRDAIQTVQPFALDVSSGVEESPGMKSAEKLSSFFAQVRGEQS